jgi:hypothetical protein
MIPVRGVWTFLRALLGRSTAVALENAAPRHQLLVLQRSVARPRLSQRDRIFWVYLSYGSRNCRLPGQDSVRLSSCHGSRSGPGCRR